MIERYPAWLRLIFVVCVVFTSGAEAGAAPAASEPSQALEAAMAAVAAAEPGSDAEERAMRSAIAAAGHQTVRPSEDARGHAEQARVLAQSRVAEDLLTAAAEAGAAARLAPWIAEYHYQHGQLLAKTGAHAAAARAFALYLESAPAARDRDAVQRLIAGLHRQKDSSSSTPRLPLAREPFRDCPRCPEMIALNGGRFLMGSPDAEQGRFDAEGPQHAVAVRAFAIGKYPVTEEQFAAFLAETGYQPAPCDRLRDKSWRSLGQGIVFPPGLADLPQQPAVCVNWNDALAYSNWINSKVPAGGYRLPSEAEWEFAARAGSASARWWGEEIGVAKANCHGCGSVWDNSLIAPVGSFGPNVFGLYDMLGNVWQWTADCWNESYTGAPADGAAWSTGDCSKRVMRGGSWSNIPVFVRSAARSRGARGGGDFDYSSYVGFRLAKSLP